MRHLTKLYKDRKLLGCFAQSICIRCLSTQKTFFARKNSETTPSPNGSLETSAVLEKFPALGERKKSSEGIYVLDDHVADRFISHLGTDLTNKEITIIETNPGPGILTKALLNAGAPNLRVVEPKAEYQNGLLEMQDTVSPERLKVIKADFFNLAKIAYTDKHSITNIAEKMFGGIPVKSWYDSTPPCIVVGILPPGKESVFLSFLSIAVTNMSIMYNLGRVQLLLFVPEKRLKIMTATPGDKLHVYCGHSIMSQIFFDVELLHKEERCNFYPHTRHISKFSKFDNDHLYLVKITPKETLMNLLSSPEDLQQLYFFIRQNCYKKSDFVISKLESWIPNCGVRLIKNGFSIFTQFNDLSPSQFLHLFMEFSSWPEYPQCSFRSALLKFSSEYDAMIDDDNDDI